MVKTFTFTIISIMSNVHFNRVLLSKRTVKLFPPKVQCTNISNVFCCFVCVWGGGLFFCLFLFYKGHCIASGKIQLFKMNCIY